jgi:glucose dehydrogenase
MFGFTSIDRATGEPIVSQDHHPVFNSAGEEGEVAAPSQGGGLDQLFSQAMDPFRLFR